MNHFKRVSALTLIAEGWFGNFTSLYKNIFLFLAFDASIISCFHFRNCARISNNDTFELDQFINVNWIQFSYLIVLFHIERPYLDHRLIFLLQINVISKSLNVLIILDIILLD